MRCTVQQHRTFTPPHSTAGKSSCSGARHLTALCCNVLLRNALHRNALHRNVLYRNALYRNVLHRNVLYRREVRESIVGGKVPLGKFIITKQVSVCVRGVMYWDVLHCTEPPFTALH